jgi:hypothetical protein
VSGRKRRIDRSAGPWRAFAGPPAAPGAAAIGSAASAWKWDGSRVFSVKERVTHTICEDCLAARDEAASDVGDA